jgi:hypothetical protein
MLQLLSSLPELRNILLGALLVGLVRLVVFWSSPRNFSSSSTFKKSRLAALVIVGLIVLGAAIYLAHHQLQLPTLLWLGSFSSFAAVIFFFMMISAPKLDTGSPDIVRASLLFLLYGVAIGCGVASLSVAAITVATNPLNSSGGIGVVSAKRYKAEIQLAGTTVVHESRESPFTASSGQRNFGCEETAPAQVAFQLPDGATVIGQPSASWRNTDNASRMNAVVSVQGNVVTATGSITGIPYQSFILGIKNCPGGGHGELVLSGAYRTDSVREVGAPPLSVTSTVSSNSNEDWITLPTPQEFKITQINIDIKDESGSVVSHFGLTPTNPLQSDGKFSALYSPQREKGQLLIRVL